MLKTQVAVLRGGPSHEYEVSLKTGQSVLTNIPSDTYQVRDVFIDRTGVWHMRGMPMAPERVLGQVDVVFNALHGAYGEDGTVQRMLEMHHVPYTGSNVLASAIGMNKPLAKSCLGNLSFRLPHHRVLTRSTTTPSVLMDIFRTFPQPSIVKPASGGSSVSTHKVHTYDSIVQAVEEAFKTSDTLLIEQYIPGREVTVVVIDHFRQERYYVLPPIEIIPAKHEFFSYEEKYKGYAQEQCPARLPQETTHALITAAREVHRTLGLRDYSRTDFIINPHGIFFLETNTLPGMTETSLLPQGLEAVGATLPSFLDHVLSLALARR